jgi:hypothetical protein
MTSPPPASEPSWDTTPRWVKLFLIFIGCCFFLFLFDVKISASSPLSADANPNGVELKTATATSSGLRTPEPVGGTEVTADGQPAAKEEGKTSPASTPAEKTAPAKPAASVPAASASVPAAPQEPSEDPFGGVNLATAEGLKQLFEGGREKYYTENLQVNYGDYYKRIFFTTNENGTKISAGNHVAFKSPAHARSPNPVKAPTKGWDAMVKKMQLKLLQVQLNYLKQKQQGKNPQKFLSKVTWANGGHR